MKELTIRKSEKPITREELNLFIDTYNLKLPNSYIEFILKNNGGYSSESLFGSSIEEGVVIDSFFSIRPNLGDFSNNLGRLVNVKKILENNIKDKDLPFDIYPFGDGGGGTFLCISMNNESLGKIYKYYWDGSGLQYVCDSFEEFIEGLE
ncbi:SMI1/KNR4 family protein [Tenacibaculum tangerinum]|uniref:SMI1/KNR4 family protein n=1 Tax=Tenacibaculum tangerinum TaxID=3038772 RepID=A0ABY8KZJ3_9FLAO|nr:SMI1/KNR4 family protein [Tenacibaculum tangerinum]WGH74648.1 SMI1/KNR4 family protein [Tenacibaculum tangerinum]